jgi:hypothetical protein
MNIFVLDLDPQKAAQYHCDKHVVKMILETAQILSTVIWKNYPDELLTELYRPTHKNHPCTLWAEKSYANMLWLYDLGKFLGEEFSYRYDKEHASMRVIKVAGLMKSLITYTEKGLTPFAQAMPNQYQESDVVKAYRRYYKYEKTQLLTYTKRGLPQWLKDESL